MSSWILDSVYSRILEAGLMLSGRQGDMYYNIIGCLQEMGKWGIQQG